MEDKNIAENLNLDISNFIKLSENFFPKYDDGEVYLEYNNSEIITFDNGKVISANQDIDSGFGIRIVDYDKSGYAYKSGFSNLEYSRLLHMFEFAESGCSNSQKNLQKRTPIKNTIHHLYEDVNPILNMTFKEKLKILEKIEKYLRSKDERIIQVTSSIAGSYKQIGIIRNADEILFDNRPLVRINISIVVKQNERRESSSIGFGGRMRYAKFLEEDKWKPYADEVLAQALINLESMPAPGGTMPVVLGAGWPGILLHEAVGHGLEADFNRKKLSAFSNLLGMPVAAKGVTVIDDGSIPSKRGSLNIDDEGTKSKENILIEDGILVGYMQDRMNARIMGVKPTGNGRRENFRHEPMPRMTNTFMLSGDKSHEEIIEMVHKGIYAANFSGGQVDITSGKFVFSASECYMIENGKITQPLKGATIIGNGPDALMKIKAIGNNMKLDEGIGTCGKNGQSVPVGVGMPSILIEDMVVGGNYS